MSQERQGNTNVGGRKNVFPVSYFFFLLLFPFLSLSLLHIFPLNFPFTFFYFLFSIDLYFPSFFSFPLSFTLFSFIYFLFVFPFFPPSFPFYLIPYIFFFLFFLYFLFISFLHFPFIFLFILFLSYSVSFFFSSILSYLPLFLPTFFPPLPFSFISFLFPILLKEKMKYCYVGKKTKKTKMSNEKRKELKKAIRTKVILNLQREKKNTNNRYSVIECLMEN